MFLVTLTVGLNRYGSRAGGFVCVLKNVQAIFLLIYARLCALFLLCLDASFGCVWESDPWKERKGNVPSLHARIPWRFNSTSGAEENEEQQAGAAADQQDLFLLVGL